MRSIQNFYGDSIRRLKGRVQSDRFQLESLADQLPQGEVRTRVQEMIDSYSASKARSIRRWGRARKGPTRLQNKQPFKKVTKMDKRSKA